MRTPLGLTIGGRSLYFLQLADATAAEEFAAPTSLVPLTDSDGWVHESRALIKRQGRTSWYTQPVPEVEEGEEPPPAAPEPEVSPQGLSSLSSDANVAPGVPAWSFRSVLNDGLDNSQAAVVKSLKWPGAATVCDLNGIKGYYWASCYVGNGAAYTGASFAPPMPPPVAEETADPVEAFDPTVDEEFKEPEPEPEEEE